LAVLGQIAGPVIISALLFFAILANFVLRGALRFMSDLMMFPLNLPDPLVIQSVNCKFAMLRILLRFNRAFYSRKGNVTIPGFAFVTQYL